MPLFSFHFAIFVIIDKEMNKTRTRNLKNLNKRWRSQAALDAYLHEFLSDMRISLP